MVYDRPDCRTAVSDSIMYRDTALPVAPVTRITYVPSGVRDGTAAGAGGDPLSSLIGQGPVTVLVGYA